MQIKSGWAGWEDFEDFFQVKAFFNFGWEEWVVDFCFCKVRFTWRKIFKKGEKSEKHSQYINGKNQKKVNFQIGWEEWEGFLIDQCH